MKYTKQIFNELKHIEPTLTTRDFSLMCGRSEGYMGSIGAQNIEASDSAIMNLMESIERKKRAIGQYDKKSTYKIEMFSVIQKDLATELINRSSLQRMEPSKPVRALVIQAFANMFDEKLNSQNSVPFVY